MMGQKTFSSEEERLLSLLDETQGPYPLLTRDDPVIFHNAEYERELLMEYNLDFGGESSCSSTQHQNYDDNEEPFYLKEEPKLEPTWFLSSSEMEDPTTSPPVIHQSSCSPPSLIQPSKPIKMPKQSAHSVRFNPYSSGPLVKEPSNTRSRGISHTVRRSESPSSKRGRPTKATSNTKMANYARNYREMKKSELATVHSRNQELEAENKLLREQNARMKNALGKSADEIAQLKKVIDQDSQIARVVATMGNSSSSNLMGSRAGVCVHVGSLGTTVEVCKQCADANQTRLDAKYKMDELSSTELFGGDFSAFDSYLNGHC